jgi:hypothetical protein
MENKRKHLSEVIDDMKKDGEDILDNNEPILITAGVGAR